MITTKNVGELISYIDERNTEGLISDFYGINIQKEFMPTVASTEGIDARKYKIVRDNRFVFSGMQTGRDRCIRIGLYKGDPIIVSPAYTSGLVGTPNELKLKYLSDNEFKDLSGDELKEAMIKRIKEKDSDLKGRMETQGTTPRQLTDLLGSLSDLTSGSGDKGTPVILIQNYFSNYANQ